MDGIRGYFDSIYSEDPDYFGPTASSFARMAVGLLLRERPGGRVAEIGCGTGQDLAYFAAHGFEVEGCDLSSVACRRANERLAALRGEVPPLEHVRPADGLSFLEGLPAGSLDAAYANLYLNLEVDDAHRALTTRAIGRALRPGGWWFVRARSTADPGVGRGLRLGPGLVDPGGGRPPLRFYTFTELSGLAGDTFEAAYLREHPDGEPDFPVVVWDGVFRRRG